MARGSISQPSSPIKTRHPERNSIAFDDDENSMEKRGSRSEASSATLLEMDIDDSPRKLDYLDLEKQTGDGSRRTDKLKTTRPALSMWMTLNTIATVAIVYATIFPPNSQLR
ncbi:MAG: hypothetical protein Q9222_006946 [Ikaeria aurantiellina]